MKIWIPALFSVLTLLGSPIVSATPQSLDHVVAIVNNGVILQTDIDTAMKTVKANAGEKGQPLPQRTSSKSKY